MDRITTSMTILNQQVMEAVITAAPRTKTGWCAVLLAAIANARDYPMTWRSGAIR